MAASDDVDIQAAAVNTLQEVELEDMISISDNKASIVEASGIMSTEEYAQAILCSGNTNNASIVPYPGTHVDTSIANKCTIASCPAALTAI